MRHRYVAYRNPEPAVCWHISVRVKILCGEKYANSSYTGISVLNQWHRSAAYKNIQVQNGPLSQQVMKIFSNWESQGVMPQICAVQKCTVCCTPACFDKKIEVMYGIKCVKSIPE